MIDKCENCILLECEEKGVICPFYEDNNGKEEQETNSANKAVKV